MIYKKGRKCDFRFTETTFAGRKPQTSSIALLLTLTSGLWLAPAHGKTMSEQSLREEVAHTYEQELAQYASINDWGPYQSDYKIWVPGSANHLPQCASELVISGRDHQSVPVGNLKRSVSCEDTDNNWRLNVTIKASLTLDVVVTETAIGRDQTVTAQSLKLEQRTLSRDDRFFTAIADATGLQTQRRIRSGQILNPRLLNAPPLVEKGNQVVIIATKDGFTASTRGVALEDGGKGEQIDVENSRSGKVVRAVVSGLNQVHTQF